MTAYQRTSEVIIANTNHSAALPSNTFVHLVKIVASKLVMISTTGQKNTLHTVYTETKERHHTSIFVQPAYKSSRHLLTY